MSDPALKKLEEFFRSAPVARKATRSLSKDVEVGVVLSGGTHARFSMETGAPLIDAGSARDPDFTLTIPDAAVDRLTSLQSDDVGEFGVEFFRLAIAKDPAVKVRIRIDAPTLRLLGRGYLGVLAAGGARVAAWLMTNGVRSPKAAIDRLRGVGRR